MRYDTSRYPETWKARVARLIASGRFPNLFAHISYFGWMLGTDSPDTHGIRAIKSMCAKFLKADLFAERLLFDTDWSFLSREDNFEAYLDNTENVFEISASAKPHWTIFFTRMRFASSVCEAAIKAFSRLEDFYGRHGKPHPHFG